MSYQIRPICHILDIHTILTPTFSKLTTGKGFSQHIYQNIILIEKILLDLNKTTV